MLYLTAQIMLIIVLATLVGLALGWSSRGLMSDIHDENHSEEDIDPFSARSRLEQCHRDNAELRRESKELEERLNHFEHAENLGREEGDLVERLRAEEARAQALLEDIQTRDDTIAILENELEKLRSTQT